MKKLVLLFSLFFLLFMSFQVRGFWVSFEGNDQTSFLNEYDKFQVAGGGFANGLNYKLNGNGYTLNQYQKFPDNNDATYLQLNGFLGMISNTSPLGSYIDWSDGSLAFMSINGNYPSYYYSWVLAPTYAKSLSSVWNSPTNLVDYEGLRFFSNSTWVPTFSSGFLENYGFKRADLIMGLKQGQVDYHVWSNSYSGYSNKVYTLTPVGHTFTKFFPGIGNSQPYMACLSGSSVCNWDSVYFNTLAVYNSSTPLQNPSVFSGVMVINMNNPGTTFSTFSTRSLVLKKGVDTGTVQYTILDCASPDEFLFDSSICPVLSYGMLSDTINGSDLDVFNGLGASFFNYYNNSSLYYIKFTSNSMSLVDVRNPNTSVYTNYFYSTGVEQIIGEISYIKAGSFQGGGGVTEGGGAGDGFLPDQPGYSGSFVKSGNIYYATGIGTYVPESQRTGNLQYNSGLRLFTCPYTMSGVLTLKLGDIPGLSILKGTSLDFDLFKPISCLYTAYVVGGDSMQKDQFPVVESKWGTGRLLEFNNTYYNASSGSRQLLFVILNLFLASPLVYLFIKFIK